MLEIVYAENSEQFSLMKKIDFMNSVGRFEYTINMMGRCKFCYCRNRFYQWKKMGSIIVKFKHEKAFRFGV